MFFQGFSVVSKTFSCVFLLGRVNELNDVVSITPLVDEPIEEAMKKMDLTDPSFLRGPVCKSSNSLWNKMESKPLHRRGCAVCWICAAGFSHFILTSRKNS